ncbi:MAG: dephospho-CoA kinase [Candidatus Omnitrophica bacterium]|nr:dephospho-CoA kinase [Candidatus Omnitrophota bacterium]
MASFAITGNFASGKSVVIAGLKNKGAVVFDADKIVHRYYRNRDSTVYKKVIRFFPEAVKKNGVICRKKLGGLVFSDVKKLLKLEGIVHPPIIKELKAWCGKADNKIFVAEVPLLFEKKLSSIFDAVIVVVAKKEITVSRAMSKYNMSRPKAVKRLSFYLPVKAKIKKADFVIYNSSNLQDLKIKTGVLWNKLKTYGKNKKKR